MKRNYLLTFILALVIASCGGSDDDEAETRLAVSSNVFTLSSGRRFASIENPK